MGALNSKSATLARNASVDAKAAATWKGNTDAQGTDERTFSGMQAPYVLPNDVKEGNRLNLQHHLIRQQFGGPNYFGVTGEQLKKGLTVLDIGCGSGIWLAEMHRDFPAGSYFGADISTTAFAETFKDLAGSDKIQLVEGNVLERLPFGDNTFDFVHQQFLVYGVPEAKWPHVIAEIHRVLKPGGVADLIEPVALFSNHDTPSKLEADMRRILNDLFKARGINVSIAWDLAGMIRKDGRFADIIERKKQAPFGWGGETGDLWKMDGGKVMASLKPFMSSALGIPAEEWESTMEKFLSDASKNRAYMNIIRVTASKLQ
ncbi:S-adenosyl-L-methionine-dependent methyltransferase [Cladochytrium replicatum]|nr:S-adenosyl-L-methionine-dependent methyltransferase [Cladochytrium replicatum]